MFSLCPFLCHLFTVSRSKLRWLYFCFSRCHIITNNRGIFNLDTFFDGKFLCIISLLFSSSSSTPPHTLYHHKWVWFHTCYAQHPCGGQTITLKCWSSFVVHGYLYCCMCLAGWPKRVWWFSLLLPSGHRKPGSTDTTPLFQAFCWYWEFKF